MLQANMAIDKNPLVLIRTLFDVVQHETKIKGYWKDEQGKVYIDNIELKTYSAINTDAFLNKVQLLFKGGEKCIFYKDFYNYGVLRYPNGTWQILKNRIAWIENRKPSEKYIDALLTFHEGLTIYELEDNNYLIEIYKG